MPQTATSSAHGRTRTYADWALRSLPAAPFFAAVALTLAGAAP